MVKKWLNKKREKPRQPIFKGLGFFGGDGGNLILCFDMIFYILECSIFNVFKTEYNRIKRPYKKLGG